MSNDQLDLVNDKHTAQKRAERKKYTITFMLTVKEKMLHITNISDISAVCSAVYSLPYPLFASSHHPHHPTPNNYSETH